MDCSDRVQGNRNMATEANQYSQQVGNVSAVYNIYRITLPMVLLITYFGSGGTGILGILAPAMFIVAASAYTLFGIIAALVYKYRPGLSAKTNFKFAVLLIDVIAIMLILLLRNFQLGIVSLVPNFLPIY